MVTAAIMGEISDVPPQHLGGHGRGLAGRSFASTLAAEYPEHREARDGRRRGAAPHQGDAARPRAGALVPAADRRPHHVRLRRVLLAPTCVAPRRQHAQPRYEIPDGGGPACSTTSFSTRTSDSRRRSTSRRARAPWRSAQVTGALSLTRVPPRATSPRARGRRSPAGSGAGRQRAAVCLCASARRDSRATEHARCSRQPRRSSPPDRSRRATQCTCSPSWVARSQALPPCSSTTVRRSCSCATRRRPKHIARRHGQHYLRECVESGDLRVQDRAQRLGHFRCRPRSSRCSALR